MSTLDLLEQELEAPSHVLTMMHDAALQLGASAEQAKEASRTGIFELDARNVSAALSIDESALVLSAPLPGAWFDAPANRRRALLACTPLMLQSGVAFCRPFGELIGGAALICRRPLNTASAARLAAWVTELAAMANMTCRLIDEETV